jgi:hypothetical protein
MSEDTPRAVTVAHYVRDSIIVLLIFGSFVALVAWGVHSMKTERAQVVSAVLKCPVCGAELELKKVERSKK